MKVCMCSFTGYKMLNGSNLRAYFLAKEFLKRGFELRYITPSKDDAKTCNDRFGVEAEDVGLSIHRFQGSRLKRYPIFALKARKKIRKDDDIVFGQSLPSALAVKLARTKAKKVVDYVDLWSEYWLYAHPSLKGRAIYQAVRRAEGFSMKKIDLNFTITEVLKRMMIERGCDESSISIVRDGVDLKMFKPFKVKNKFYDKYNLNKKDDYVVYQGGIGAHDGVQFLLNAVPQVVKKNPNVKFLIVGTGDYVNNIKDQAKRMKLGKSVIFTGWVNYEEMPSFMNLAKINSVPLPDANATRGVVTYKLMEAIACGIPTIISDLPGVNEAVKHNKTAYLCKSEDTQALSLGILKLIENKKLYKKIKDNGFKMIKDHDWRDIAKDMVDEIEKIV